MPADAAGIVFHTPVYGGCHMVSVMCVFTVCVCVEGGGGAGGSCKAYD